MKADAPFYAVFYHGTVTAAMFIFCLLFPRLL